MKKYATVTVIVMLLALGTLLGFEELSGDRTPIAKTIQEQNAKHTFWVALQHNASDPGPYIYVAREFITMPDGTRVVCVATLRDLWCRDAK